MALLNKPDLLDAPIPGQSLTSEPGSQPWEQPPKLTTVDEAVEHYVPMLRDEEILSDALSNIESGVALTTLADVITKAGAMTGLHSIDVGLMVAPILVELFISAADAAGIEYTIGTEKKKKSGSTSASRAAALREMMGDEESVDIDEPTTEEVQLPAEEPEEASMGMMTRRGV
tara:strand:+ start:1007 stop:1525 length:519 start_codon:yes stop_codon:yes gene_type:complete